VDTRDADLHQTQAISGSINISSGRIQEYFEQQGTNSEIDKLSLDSISEMISQQEREKLSQRKRLYCILIISNAQFPEEFIEQVKKLAKADEFADFCEIPQKYVADDFEKVALDMEERNSIVIGQKILKLMQEDKVRELYILLDGAKNFFNRYPYMDPSFHRGHALVRSNSLIAQKLDFTFNFPNDIWSSRLFLGSFNQACQYLLIKSLNITHVVNVTAECTNVHETKGIKYLHVCILDETEVNVHKFFKEIYEFIDSAMSEDSNHRVLIHCALGKSRSATVTIMYLMKKFQWGFEQALEYVKTKRKTVDPNYGFLKQLEEFEKSKCVF